MSTFSTYTTNLPLDPIVQKHLRRVYNALTSALIAATIGSLLSLRLISNGSNWPSYLASFLVIPSLFYFYSLPPHSPRRSVAFHAFAFLDGCGAAPLLSTVISIDPRIPPLAFLGSATVFACCSISSIFAKRRSYLFLSSFLFTGLMGLSVMSLVALFWRDMAPYGAIMYLGLLLFCAFVLYDTQLIIEKIHVGERDHLQHALTLLIDFMAILKRVMIIMANNRKSRSDKEDRRKRSQCSQ